VNVGQTVAFTASATDTDFAAADVDLRAACRCDQRHAEHQQRRVPPPMPFSWTDTNPATLPAQFYRVKAGPPLP
jgi:hypothetical protein